MLSKSIIDANVFVQDVLKKYGLMDYQSLKNGEKKKLDVILYIGEEKFETKMSCYQVLTHEEREVWFNGSQFKENFHLAT